MTALLNQHTGIWIGTNKFRLMPTDPQHDSGATASVSTAAADNMAIIAYTWSHPEDGDQDGLLVIGPGEGAGEVVALWGDSWHQSPVPKPLAGIVEDGVITVSYEYGDGGWQWQIILNATDASVLEIRMDNVVPPAAGEGLPGGPYSAMAATLRRAP